VLFEITLRGDDAVAGRGADAADFGLPCAAAAFAVFGRLAAAAAVDGCIVCLGNNADLRGAAALALPLLLTTVGFFFLLPQLLLAALACLDGGSGSGSSLQGLLQRRSTVSTSWAVAAGARGCGGMGVDVGVCPAGPSSFNDGARLAMSLTRARRSSEGENSEPKKSEICGIVPGMQPSVRFASAAVDDDKGNDGKSTTTA